MATRAQVNVFDTEGNQKGQTAMPFVFSAPIRPDVVNFVHTNVAKNKRQAYSVNKLAGHQTSAVPAPPSFPSLNSLATNLLLYTGLLSSPLFIFIH